jgi:hypothetical protein
MVPPPITPFELALRHELEGEFVRMASQWFFRWFNINNEGMIVDVEDFYGGRFHTGGIVFQGQIQSLYWRSVEKYLLDVVHQRFRLWYEAAQLYPHHVQQSSLQRTAGQLQTFCARICTHAVDIDRRLRGRGNPQSVQPYNATGVQSAGNAEIDRLRQAYSGILSDASLVATEAGSGAVPASDRFVRLDHNSTEFRDVVTKLEQIVEALRANNEYAANDPEEHEQRIAEIESGNRLLRAVRVRLAAVATVLLIPLGWLGIKFATGLVSELVTATIGLLKGLLGPFL